MTGIRRVSQLGTTGESTYVDGSIFDVDIHASANINKTKISGTAVTVADTGTITSTMILDGTILNEDVNASAAIAQSKIANLTSDLAAKAPLAGAAFTGNVTVPNTSNIYFGSANGSNFWRPIDGYNNSYIKIATGSFYIDAADYIFRNASSSVVFTVASDGTFNGVGSGNFTTMTSQGRGVGIKAPVGDGSAGILQFTNNGQSVQWASITSTEGVLNLNATYTRVSTNLAIGNAATGYRLEVDGRMRIRDNAGGTAGIWYTNSAGAETVFGGLVNSTTWGVFSVGGWRFSVSDTLTTIGTESITLGGVGTNAVSIPYCAMLINRLWEGYPGIQVNNDTTWGGVGEFRIHGYSGISGGDFGVNLRIDGTYLTASDGRMKTDVSTIGGALDTVKNLRGVKYLRINRELDADIPDTSMTEGVKYGFIAQEIMQHAPEVVFQTPNHEPLENGWANEFAVDYGGLTPLLVEAIKELEARLKTLEGHA